jgi:hypothetical protein
MLEPKRLLIVALVAASILSILVAVGGWAATSARGQPTTTNNQTTTTGGNETMTSGEMEHQLNSTVVRDSQTVLLEGKSLPANDYIHLYDTTPYMIMNGHIAAKVPCDANSNPEVQVLIGSAPDLNPADFELVNELSNPGGLCIYHVDLMSNSSATTGGGNATATIITDIAISNPSNSNMTFPATSTVVIGVNEIMPLEGGHEPGGDSHAEGAGGEVS